MSQQIDPTQIEQAMRNESQAILQESGALLPPEANELLSAFISKGAERMVHERKTAPEDLELALRNLRALTSGLAEEVPTLSDSSLTSFDVYRSSTGSRSASRSDILVTLILRRFQFNLPWPF